ncbi:hypothetical protein KFE25_007042 [Diacronema lutheri]|uniref:Uncharacterized protein n=1 Tax=Diacronema lutheri TaxID=2081491 RepID=A0A8J6CFG3_DIALT|nr:hypothetical protein KFE25_007042 [Diacronema lutheri]
MGKSARNPSDPFGESEETRGQSRARAAEARKAPPKRARENDEKPTGIRCGPLIMMLMIVGGSLLPALAKLADSLGHLGFTWFKTDPNARLLRFYEAHNPSKLGEVPNVVRKYRGREEELFSKLEAKYGIRP